MSWKHVSSYVQFCTNFAVANIVYDGYFSRYYRAKRTHLETCGFAGRLLFLRRPGRRIMETIRVLLSPFISNDRKSIIDNNFYSHTRYNKSFMLSCVIRFLYCLLISYFWAHLFFFFSFYLHYICNKCFCHQQFHLNFV